MIRRSWVRAPPAHQRLAERTLTTKVYAGTDPLTGREIRFGKTRKTERSVLHREPAPRRCSTCGTPPHGSATAAARTRCGTTPTRSPRPAGGAPPTSRSRPQNLLRDLLSLDLAVRYGCRSATWPRMTVRRIPSSASQTLASASRRPLACENLRGISAAGLPGGSPAVHRSSSMACCPVLLPVCPVLSAVVQAAARSGSGGGGLVAGRRMRRGRALPAVARPGGRGGGGGRAWRRPPGGRARDAGAGRDPGRRGRRGRGRPPKQAEISASNSASSHCGSSQIRSRTPRLPRGWIGSCRSPSRESAVASPGQ